MKQKTEILKKAKKIKLAIFDVDGVLTDGKLYFSPTGAEHKVFHVQDGLGIQLLQKTGVIVAIISGRTSTAVAKRIKTLGVKHIYQGQNDKIPVFETLIAKLKISAAEVAYTGDDLPDLPIIQRVGLGITVPNANAYVKQQATWETKASGGQGAVREICELIMEAQNNLNRIHKSYL